MSTNLSVIIPTLNEEHYLPHLLSDLAAQTEKDFEVIVVDGKSEDKTKEKALTFLDKFSLTFLEVEKRNVSFQRNTGAKVAKGKYIVFIDADTRIPHDFIENLAHAAFKRGFKLILPTISWDDTSRKARVLRSVVTSVIRASQLYGRPLSTGGNFAVEKDLFEQIGGFNEEVFISEDHDLVRKSYEFGVKAKIVKNVKATISMRRGALEGDASLIYKHVVGFLAYTMSPNEKALRTKLFEYEMGGHRYDKNEKLHGKSAKLKKKIDVARLKQLLQLSSIALLVRFFK